jgi:hypothetical protein
VTNPGRNAGAVRLAVLVSGLLIGFQVAGKATRDALFLSQFPVTMLPSMVFAAAIISMLAAVITSRVMGRLGPGRVVPALLGASAALQVGEWLLYAVAPRSTAVLVYIHFNALGALMVSAFWSLINERFDPRAAKQSFAYVGAAGTVGGVLGGLFAERTGALLPVQAMLPALAVVHFICAMLVIRIRAVPVPAGKATSAPAAVSPAGFRALAGSHYLRLLAAALLLSTVSEGLLDYVFKDAAKHAFGHGPELLRFFALFYAGINLAGGLMVALIGRRSLEKFGIARTVSSLPWGVAVGGVTAIAFPGLASAVFARASEATMRNGLYRSGFELLFTPLPPEEKRAAKPLLDVAAVRVGDMLAAALIQIALIAWALHSSQLLLVMAVLSAIVGIILTFRIHEGYVAALENSLVKRGSQLELGDAVLDRRTRMSLAQSSPEMLEAIRDFESRRDQTPIHEMPVLGNAAMARLMALHSNRVTKIETALAEGPLEPAHVARVIDLLGRDEIGGPALEALSAAAPRHIGQLVDALLDPDTPFAVRRRIPAAIVAARSQRALDGLLGGLGDPRFEVRARCGRAMVRLVAESPGLRVDPPRIIAAVLEEVAVDREVWESQQLVGEDVEDPLQAGALRDRASRSLEHVFTMLSLVMPRQPLQIAFQGLHTDDPQLRGTALEYLETALPVPVRVKLWPYIGDRPIRPSTARPKEQVVAELMAARASIMMTADEVRRLENG